MQNSFRWWKFNTLSQNIVFFMVILTAIFIFVKIVKKVNKDRNDENAFEKVSKNFKKLSGKSSYIIENFTMGGMGVQGLLIDDYGVVLLRAIGFGIEIKGSNTSQKWEVSDFKTTKEIENPLPMMKDFNEKIKKFLRKEKIENVPIENLVVFTDNYRTPEIKLESEEETIILANLKNWYQSRKSNKKMDISLDKIYEILNQEKK